MFFGTKFLAPIKIWFIALFYALRNAHRGEIVSSWEARHSGIYLVSGLETQIHFCCRSQNCCLKNTGLSAGINQIILDAAFGSKAMWEWGRELQWFPFETGRGGLSYNLYLHNDRWFSHILDLINQPYLKLVQNFDNAGTSPRKQEKYNDEKGKFFNITTY